MNIGDKVQFNDQGLKISAYIAFLNADIATVEIIKDRDTPPIGWPKDWKGKYVPVASNTYWDVWVSDLVLLQDCEEDVSKFLFPKISNLK